MEVELPAFITYEEMVQLVCSRVFCYTTVGMLKIVFTDCLIKLSPQVYQANYDTIDNFRRNINGFGKDHMVLTASQIRRIQIDLTEKTTGSRNKPTRQWVCSSVYPDAIDSVQRLIAAITLAQPTGITELVRSYYNNTMYADADIPDSVYECLCAHGWDQSQLFFTKPLDKILLLADLAMASQMPTEIKLPQQSLFRDVIMGISRVLSSGGCVSTITNSIEAFYRMQDAGVLTGGYDVNVIKLNSVFTKHHWAWERSKTGFQKMPDIMFLLSDIQDIIDQL